MKTIHDFLNYTVEQNASDLHINAFFPPTVRINGQLLKIPGTEPLQPDETEKMVFEITGPERKELLLANKDIDFSHAIDKARFRVNAYFQKGSLSANFRFIPTKIKSIEELNLPKICHDFTELNQGFILVTGPTGHGKSTSLASMINEINKKRLCHIVTIEDPIEYVYPRLKSIVSQREMGQDTLSWSRSLRSILREDPDVVLIGEMRDFETIASALTIAETGHLVLTTLHTNSASQTIDRVVGVFPEDQQNQIRMQLSLSLEGVLSQRLVPTLDGKRIPAVEILIATNAVRAVIREGKTHLLDNIIQTSGEFGMISLEGDLTRLVREGAISLETAKKYAVRPEEIIRLFQKSRI